MSNIADYLNSRDAKDRRFSVKPRMSAEGDFVSVFFKDEMYVAETVDEVLTVFFSTANDSIIGFRVKGISQIAANHSYHIDHQAAGDTIRIEMMLDKFRATAKGKQKFFYRECRKLFETESATAKIGCGLD